MILVSRSFPNIFSYWTFNVTFPCASEQSDLKSARLATSGLTFIARCWPPALEHFLFFFSCKISCHSVPSEKYGWKRNDHAGSEMESIKLTEGIAERWCVTVLTVISRLVWEGREEATYRKRKTVRLRSTEGAYTRAMIDAPKLRACPLSEIKLANRAGDRPVGTLLVVAAPGCVIRRTFDPMPDFFSRIPSPTLPHPLFSEGEFLDTGNWRKRVTPERASGGGGWIFVIMKRR